MQDIMSKKVLRKGWLFNKDVVSISIGDFVYDKFGMVKKFYIEINDECNLTKFYTHKFKKRERYYKNELIKYLKLRVDQVNKECFIVLKGSPLYVVSINGTLKSLNV